ncbi:SDR family NAD(P)-dependent oxidoreductase [Mycobacterium simiae]|uniref:SDR family NAD(P)-dependent oxidoreductase n=1 Tax=Mycobacterium simiae TaxID=1784 RepID=UPI00042867BA|nr:SDR family oxidoreductase [Mycobacterium simiae]PLV54860.1 oxidoreductase [Mycobacterium tuberculosis variant microti OV254]BBX41953.1 oxidoreductase [Mycobacterium simiae]
MTLHRNAASLDGRVAVVTGGGGGIGSAIAAAFAEFGARVAIWEKHQQTATAVAARVGGLACVTDVRDAEQVDAALATTVDALGVPIILVNNAGGVFWSGLLDTSLNGWDALIRSNLTQVLLCTQRVARAMVEAGQGGSVINISTIEAVRAAPGFAAYAAAKAGVVNFTKTAALELAPHNIRVNGLAPDFTLTESLAKMAPNGTENAKLMVPMGRAGHVDEMAGAAMFLASDLSAYVTGQTLHIDGGTSAAGGWCHHPQSGRYILGPTTPVPK